MTASPQPPLRAQLPAVAACGPGWGTTSTTAAARLLAALWRDERDGCSELDHFHLIAVSGLLTESDLIEVGREVWPVT